MPPRRPVAPARATPAPSSRRRWCCGTCRWASRSARRAACFAFRRPPRPALVIFVLLCQWRTKGLENMFQHEELVGSSWIAAYSLCFSCGYFAYDQLDMLRYRLYSGWILGILMHHLILLICFTPALYRNVTISYLILTLQSELSLFCCANGVQGL